jgi:hypothetical protein
MTTFGTFWPFLGFLSPHSSGARNDINNLFEGNIELDSDLEPLKKKKKFSLKRGVKFFFS